MIWNIFDSEGNGCSGQAEVELLLIQMEAKDLYQKRNYWITLTTQT